MRLERDFMLARARDRDPDFDGVFLTCVRTTGIYCLPSCSARTPRPANVEHALSPGEARSRGFRPCKRCRPDDHYAGRDADRQALLAAHARVLAAPGDHTDVSAFARAAGCGATKLLLTCRRHLHRTPADVLLLVRLEHARAALASSTARVLDVALGSGFEGSSAFHANFRRQFGLSPRGYRQMLATDRFALQLPADLPLAECLRHQARDPESASERLNGNSLHQALPLADGRAGVVSLRPIAHGVRVDVSMADGRLPGRAAMADAHAAVVRMLRLDYAPAAGERQLARDPALRPLLARGRSLRPWSMASAFDCLCFAILGQQVHVGFARQLRRDLARRAGVRIGDLVSPPTPALVAALDTEDLRRLHASAAKAEALLEVARAATAGSLDLAELARGSAEVAAARLQQLRGVGPWTAQYVLLRGLGFLDCLPLGDSALATAAERTWSLPARPDDRELARRCAAFAPHRSLLTFHLWRSLPTDLPGNDDRPRIAARARGRMAAPTRVRSRS